MQTETWNVTIHLADTGGEVTAVARLEGPEHATGTGCAPYDGERPTGQDFGRLSFLAARRALEELGTSFDYLQEVRRYVLADQA